MGSPYGNTDYMVWALFLNSALQTLSGGEAGDKPEYNVTELIQYSKDLEIRVKKTEDDLKAAIKRIEDLEAKVP